MFKGLRTKWVFSKHKSYRLVPRLLESVQAAITRIALVILLIHWTSERHVCFWSVCRNIVGI